MEQPSGTTRRRDLWPFVLFAAHLGVGLWFARRYPNSIWDPDLVAYFVYFQNWLSGTTGLHGIDYFTVPKLLMVAVLGPLRDAQIASLVTLLVSGLLGVLVYLVAGRVFGRVAGVVTALVMLLDVDRAVLTLRSSADLYVTTLLFGAIWCTLTRRYVWSALAIGVAALAKPVALPCALHLLAIGGPDRRRAVAAMPLSFLAVPLLALANHALLGSVSGSARFFAAFDAYHLGERMTGAQLVHFVGWIQLKQVIFGSTAAFGLLGVAAWLGRDRARLASPMMLVPGLFLGGYVAMSLVVPFVPISRFFWAVQLWFMAFIVHGMLEASRWAARAQPGLRFALPALLVLFLADDLFTRQIDYRRRAAQPFEDAMAFAQRARPVIDAERMQGETVLTSLAFVPWLVWTLDDVRARPALVRTALAGADEGEAPRPDWIVYAPTVFLGGETRTRFDRLLASGDYEPRFVHGTAAVFARRGRVTPLDRTARVAR